MRITSPGAPVEGSAVGWNQGHAQVGQIANVFCCVCWVRYFSPPITGAAENQDSNLGVCIHRFVSPKNLEKHLAMCKGPKSDDPGLKRDWKSDDPPLKREWSH